MIIYVKIFEDKAIELLGILCATFNIINFGAPLSDLVSLIN